MIGGGNVVEVTQDCTFILQISLGNDVGETYEYSMTSNPAILAAEADVVNSLVLASESLDMEMVSEL